MRPRSRAALLVRVKSLLSVTANESIDAPLISRLALSIESYSARELWFAAAMVHGELPTNQIIRRLRRVRELDSGWAAVSYLMSCMPSGARGRDSWPLTIAGAETTVVDVSGLLDTEDHSEQRVLGRRLARDLARATRVVPVTWTANQRAFRSLTSSEVMQLGLETDGEVLDRLIVPFLSHYVLVGIVVRPRAGERLIAMGDASSNLTVSVGYSLNELFSAENFERQMGEERFAWHVAAQRSLDHLVVFDRAAEVQFRGWKRMLPAIGVAGPQIHRVESAREFDVDGFLQIVTAIAQSLRAVESTLNNDNDWIS
jgi:hypothetical protein